MLMPFVRPILILFSILIYIIKIPLRIVAFSAALGWFFTIVIYASAIGAAIYFLQQYG